MNIVMTGGTSGIGKFALASLAREGARIVLGARRSGPQNVETIDLDLARLSSVRAFASVVHDRLGGNGIDALILNAGIQSRSIDERTADGFETTFAVNHLAHYLLLRLLQPDLAQGATVVLTTSGTHDPEEKTLVPPPRHARAPLLAHPEVDPEKDKSPTAAAGRAYSSSKLCNLLTARAFAARPEILARGIGVIAFDPGPTPGTGLLRNGGPVLAAVWRSFGFLLRPAFSGSNRPETAGRVLSDLARGAIERPEGRLYATLRSGRLSWPEPSLLARRDEVAEALWIDSAELVGLTDPAIE
jgi:NAD(P)-dependent dehydrogenase (short-subunit alcohol dehydrogenase family)